MYTNKLLVLSILIAAGALMSGCGIAGDEMISTSPFVVVTEPARRVELDAATGGIVSIEYVASDFDGTSLTDVLADIDGDLNTTGDQIVIASGRPTAAGNAPQVVAWDTRGVPAGTYRIFARTTDVLSTAVDHSSGMVVINPIPMIQITAPATDVTISRGGLVPIRYIDQGPASGATTLAVDVDGDPATTFQQLDIATLPIGTPGTQERTFLWNSTGNPFSDVYVLGTAAGNATPPVQALSAGRIRSQNVALARMAGRPLGGPFAAEVVIRDVATTPDGGFVVVGEFEGSPVFAAGEPNETIITAPVFNNLQQHAMFVARYDAAGAFQWVRAVDSPGSAAQAVAALPDGSCLLAVHLGADATFGGGETNETTIPSAGVSLAIARYNTDGSLASAFPAVASAGQVDSGGIAALPDGSYFVAGRGRGGSLTFGPGQPGEVTLGTSTVSNPFVARFAPDGRLVWARIADHAGDGGGAANSRVRVAATPDGVTITGTYLSRFPLVFDRGGPNETALPSRPGQTVLGAFVARYGADGTFRWARHVESVGLDTSRAEDIAMYPDGSSVVVGSFSSTATFGTGEPNQTVLGSAGAFDAFVARYGADGNLAWARRIGGLDFTGGTGIAALADGSCAVTGRFDGAVSIAPVGPGATSPGGADTFLARLAADGSPMWLRSVGATVTLGGAPPRVSAYGDGATVVVSELDGLTTVGAGEANETVLEPGGPDAGFMARFNADGGF